MANSMSEDRRGSKGRLGWRAACGGAAGASVLGLALYFSMLLDRADERTRQVSEQSSFPDRAAIGGPRKEVTAEPPEQVPLLVSDVSGTATTGPDHPPSSAKHASLGGLLREIAEREPRDEAWAVAIEDRVRSAVQAVDGVVIRALDCASTRCGVTMVLPTDDLLSDMPGWFGDGKLYFEADPTGDGAYETTAVFVRRGYTFGGQRLAAGQGSHIITRSAQSR